MPWVADAGVVGILPLVCLGVPIGWRWHWNYWFCSSAVFNTVKLNESNIQRQTLNLNKILAKTFGQFFESLLAWELKKNELEAEWHSYQTFYAKSVLFLGPATMLLSLSR